MIYFSEMCCGEIGTCFYCGVRSAMRDETFRLKKTRCVAPQRVFLCANAEASDKEPDNAADKEERPA